VVPYKGRYARNIRMDALRINKSGEECSYHVEFSPHYLGKIQKVVHMNHKKLS